MLKNIMIVFLLGCVFIKASMSANADNILISQFKSPFSIFGEKKEEKETLKDKEELDLKQEATELIKMNNKVYDPQNKLGITYAENTVKKAEFYFEEKDLSSAQETIDSIKNWLYKSTEYHTDLFKSLQRADNSQAQANIERTLAVNFAVLRDRAVFLEAKIFIKKGENQKATANLVEVVRSQPTTDLGFDAYQLLKEIGFSYGVDSTIVR